MVPRLTTLLVGPLQELEQRILDRMPDIERWLRTKWQEHAVPFYAYAAPEPPGLRESVVEPSAAYYHREMGEFLLPYEAVRNASNPDAMIESFVESTYDRAATLAKWDRRALERARP